MNPQPTPEQIRAHNLNAYRITFNTLQAVIQMLPADQYPAKITLAAAGKTIQELFEREKNAVRPPLQIPAELSAAADIPFPADLNAQIIKNAKDSHYYRIWTTGKV